MQPPSSSLNPFRSAPPASTPNRVQHDENLEDDNQIELRDFAKASPPSSIPFTAQRNPPHEDIPGDLRPIAQIPPETASAINHIENRHIKAHATELASDHAVSKAPLDAENQNRADIKTSKTAAKNLVAAGAVTGFLGLLTVAFVPPLGVALLCCSGSAFASAADTGVFAAMKPKVSKEDLQKFEQREAVLNDSLELFKKHPKKNPPDGTSFEEFLETCPHKMVDGTPTYPVEHLEAYIAIFDKQLKLNEVNKKVATLEGEIAEEMKALNVPDPTKSAQAARLNTQNNIQEGVYTRQTHKLEAYEKKVGDAHVTLNSLGVNLKDPNSIREGIAAQKANTPKLKEDLTKLKEKERVLHDEHKELSEKFKECNEKIEDLKNSKFEAAKNFIGQKLLDHEPLKDQRRALKGTRALLEAQLEKKEKELTKNKEDQTAKQKEIANSEAQIAQFLDFLSKKEPAIRPLRKNISETEELRRNIPFNSKPIVTAAKVIEELQMENNALQRPRRQGDDDKEFDKKIEQNNEQIAKLTPIAEKEQKIALLLNPHITQINALEKEIGNQMQKLAEANPSIPVAKNMIEYLKKENDAMNALPVPLNPEQEKQFDQNVDKIKDLESHIKTLDSRLERIKEYEKKIDSLYGKITPTQDEIILDKLVIAKKIASGDHANNLGEDLRVGNSKLEKWLKQPVQSQQDPIVVSSENINIFGTYNNRPHFGRFDDDPAKQWPANGFFSKSKLDIGQAGAAINMSEKEFRDIGRANKNNFLSNANGPVTIEGKEYKSVTHYMIKKKLDNEIERLERDKPFDYKAHISVVKTTQEFVDKSPTPKDACRWVEIQSRYGAINIHPSMFHGMDDDLKKALFYKFVGPDGKPTEEGKMLLATGDKQLYAGYELGDKTYGMEFTVKGEMVGENKLGNCLMELRDWLRREERKAAQT